MERDIVERFESLVMDLGASAEACQRWSDQFATRYTEPQRHYHTLSHIASMFACLEQGPARILDNHALSLAIFFHDWIYDPTQANNEVQSVQAFGHFASEVNLQVDLRKKVNKYIESTISHTLPEDGSNPERDVDLLLFLDADLEVLARPTSEYELYAQQIRTEYKHYNDDAYRKGRAKVLKSFLLRDRIYFSDIFADHENVARRNIEEEIAMLDKV